MNKNQKNIRTYDDLKRPYYVSSLGGKAPKTTQKSPDIVEQTDKVINSEANQQGVNLLNRASFMQVTNINSKEIQKNIVKFANSINPGMHKDVLKRGKSVTKPKNEKQKKAKSRHKRAKTINIDYGVHMARTDNDINQVYKYPKFSNMHILKIIENELKFELEMRNDIDYGKEVNGDESKVVKKEKYMSKGSK